MQFLFSWCRSDFVIQFHSSNMSLEYNFPILPQISKPSIVIKNARTILFEISDFLILFRNSWSIPNKKMLFQIVLEILCIQHIRNITNDRNINVLKSYYTMREFIITQLVNSGESCDDRFIVLSKHSILFPLMPMRINVAHCS